MKLLIIGSDSFIARNFIKKYSAQYAISGISRRLTNLINELVLTDFFTIPDSYFQNVDVVINFAAIVHKSNIRNRTALNNINYKLAVYNAQQAKRAKVKFFVQMSSIAVYGYQTPINIRLKPNPLTTYAFSKLLADEAIIDLATKEFKVSILRPPLVYGGEETPGNMIRLIRFSKKRVPLPFKGIDNRRDFIHVKNLIQYLDYIIRLRLDGIKLMTDMEPVSTAYLFYTISELLGRKPKFIKVPNFTLHLLKYLKPGLYHKLFTSLEIEPNLPSDACRIRYSVIHGLHEMVTYNHTVKASNSHKT